MIITRFAPAPTGFLHLGHVLNIVYVWGVAHRLSGRVLLRIEDHDRVRSRPEYEAAILEDLDWLGFRGDEPMVRQSDRDDIYLQTIGELRQRGLVYACSCSRAEIASTRYPGTCRDRALEERGNGLRIRLEPSTERFVDLRHGAQEQRPFEQCGDLLARDRDGNWTYQFAATVDDLTQRVTLVIRGDDLLESTGRQLQLARLLGRVSPPQFLHHALILKSTALRSARPGGALSALEGHPSTIARGALSKVEGQKLSKSDRDTGVRDLRAQGWTPGGVIGRACELAGLISEWREVRADDVSSIIDIHTPG